MNFYFFIIINVIFVCRVASDDELKKMCVDSLCIAKCCPENESVNRNRRCVYFKSKMNFDEIFVYDNNFFNTSKSVRDVFNLVPRSYLGVDIENRVFMQNEKHFNVYLTEEGNLYLEKPNDFNRWTKRDNHHFCIDYEVMGEGENMTARPAFWVVLSDLQPQDLDEHKEWNMFVTAALFVSCFFLMITLGVYIILPELRNLCGMILMGYVVTLLIAYMLHASTRILVIQGLEHSTCLNLTLCIYFSLLSSFFWMNIMSFDIWWTFRGYAKARPIHRRGEFFKFCVYATYAWGVPMAMTLAMYLLYHADLRHIPWFIKPNIECFLSDGVKLLYLYVPMLILIMCNWMFFAMTAYNVWRLSRNTGVLESAAAGRPADHRSQRNRFMVYVKLSVVMGVSWVLEIVSYLTPALKVWHLTDAYHALIGLIIFLIFICKEKIIKKSVKSIRQSNRFRRSTYTKGHSTSTTDYEFTTQETPLQVCPNPSGAYYKQK